MASTPDLNIDAKWGGAKTFFAGEGLIPLDFRVRGVCGLKSTLLSGEGLVAEFEGSGWLWIQTRSIGDFIGWLSSLMPKRD